MKTKARNIRAMINCPHCMAAFKVEDTRWVAAHSQLQGDPLLGADEQKRFLPTRFDLNGLAIDVRGESCQEIACPKCHLIIPESLLELPSMILSVCGSPGSGKSYFLASAVNRIRETLLTKMALRFEDAHPELNTMIIEYEKTLFFNSDNQLKSLIKTETVGDLYQSVAFPDRTVWYAKPFAFNIRPTKKHHRYDKARAVSRCLCIYDNAGEHFLPGGLGADDLGTQHLPKSSALLFLFDPTQNAGFRKALSGKSDDPQLGEKGWSHRQDQVLVEAGRRIRAALGLSSSEPIEIPLIVVVTKYDAWQSLIPNIKLERVNPYKKLTDTQYGINTKLINSLGDELEELVTKHAPEVASIVSDFSNDVTYVPVSAQGCPPIVNPESGLLSVRPSELKPIWIEVPLVLAINKSCSPLIPRAVAASNKK